MHGMAHDAFCPPCLLSAAGVLNATSACLWLVAGATSHRSSGHACTAQALPQGDSMETHRLAASAPTSNDGAQLFSLRHAQLPLTVSCVCAALCCGMCHAQLPLTVSCVCDALCCGMRSGGGECFNACAVGQTCNGGVGSW
jgi:hypothetical protein